MSSLVTVTRVGERLARIDRAAAAGRGLGRRGLGAGARASAAHIAETAPQLGRRTLATARRVRCGASRRTLTAAALGHGLVEEPGRRVSISAAAVHVVAALPPPMQTPGRSDGAGTGGVGVGVRDLALGSTELT